MRFDEKVIALDRVLTGHSVRDCTHTMQNQAHNWATPQRVVYESQLYYLSDGGYSRLGLHWDDASVRLFLAEGLERVEAAWETAEAKKLRREIEEGVREFLKDIG